MAEDALCRLPLVEEILIDFPQVQIVVSTQDQRSRRGRVVMTAKILFSGDVHGHCQHVIDAVREHAPAAIVLLGDI